MNFFSLFKRNLIFKLKKKISIDHNKHLNQNLDELFYFYGSDKANFFTNRETVSHGFSKYYEKHFSKLKNKKINILEIGSYSGASAAALVKYFPNAKVYCFDINISNFKYKSKNIFVFGLDINNKVTVDKILARIFDKEEFNKFDIIIDDGSHNLKDMLVSLKFFYRYLKNNRYFIVEDFKFPNYFNYNKDIDHILFDEVLENLKNKNFFNSDILKKEDQKFLMQNIKTLNIYKGNLKHSDICFIEKN